MCKSNKRTSQKTAKNKLENLFKELDKYLSDSNLVSSLLYYKEPQNTIVILHTVVFITRALVSLNAFAQGDLEVSLGLHTKLLFTSVKHSHSIDITKQKYKTTQKPWRFCLWLYIVTKQSCLSTIADSESL